MDRIHRIDKDKVDRTEDAVSHVTETGIGTATDPNPEMVLHHCCTVART